MADKIDALKLAVLFHDKYENLAPHFGYQTREETRVFDPTTPNGRLMLTVCAEILDDLLIVQPKVTRCDHSMAEPNNPVCPGCLKWLG